jgi:ketosteroid isomerase-like protein
LITAVLFAVLLDASAALAQADNRNNANAAAVRAVLEAQAAAWNRGDIDGYMDGYARDETTTFISGDTVTRGWKTVLDRYKQTYDTREKMGTLAFSELNIIGFGDVYFVTGRWQLTRLGDTPRGRFTLLLRRTPAGWRIFHDHTSSAP